MAINYHEGRIDELHNPVISRILRISDMDELSEGYCSEDALWLDAETKPVIEAAEICYSDGQISQHSNPEDWLRVIRLPQGYLIDGSHKEDFQDEEGKLIAPLSIHSMIPGDALIPVPVLDYIQNDMQLEATANILRDQYGFELGKSVLRLLAEKFHDETFGDEEDHPI